MIIEYDRTIEDCIEFNLFHMAHSPSIQRQILIWRILMTFLTIALPLGFFYILDRQFLFTPISFLISILGGTLIFFIYPYLNQKSTIGRLKQMLSEGNNKSILGHQVMSMSPEGILNKSHIGESKLNWTSIDRVLQNEKYIFLYMSSTNAIVIPVKAFANENQRQEFLNHINTHIEHKTESDQLAKS